MKKINRPTYTVADSFNSCIQDLGQCDLEKRLKIALPRMLCAEQEYIVKGEISELFSVSANDSISGIVSKDEMSKIVYGRVFSKAGKQTRLIYDSIKSSSPNSICPLCGHRVVYQVDHFLPKSKYVDLSITPINLIPICRDCNELKKAWSPQNKSEQLFHPYFDDIDSEQWLYAEIKENNPPALIYKPKPPVFWNDDDKNRIATHFAKLELGYLYSANAASEITAITEYLKDLACSAGEAAVKDHLNRQVAAYSVYHVNTWRHAMYQALSCSNWYCSIYVAN